MTASRTVFKVGETVRFQLNLHGEVVDHPWNGTECIIEDVSSIGRYSTSLFIRPVDECPMKLALGLSGIQCTWLSDHFFEKIELLDIRGDNDDDCI